MPAIRDGRGVLTEYDMTPLQASELAPVVRRQASAERMADFAAERARAAAKADHRALGTDLHRESTRRGGATAAESRARGAKAAGFVKGATKPHQEDPVSALEHHDAGTNRIRQLSADGAAAATKGRQGRRVLPADRDERIRVVLEAVRELPGYVEVGEKLGVTRNRIEQIVSELRRAGQLPEDLRILLDGRRHAGARAGGIARAAQRTPPSEEVVGVAEPPTTEAQAPEASAPATAADELPATGPADEQVATPPEPTLAELLEAAARTARARAAMAAELAAFDRDLRRTLDLAEAEMRKAIA